MGKDLKGNELGIGIRQRADGRYEARAVIQGETICLYNMNLQKLKKEFKEKKDAINQNLDKQSKMVTLSEWFDYWFETYKKPYLKESSAIAMQSRFSNVFSKRLGDFRLCEINNMMIQGVINDEVKKGRAAYNIREVSGVLKNCLESAKNNRLILSNPAFEVMLPKVEKGNKPIRFLTREEQIKFLKYCENNWYYEMFYIMFFSGLRIGEVGALSWEDVDFDEKCINIHHSMSNIYNKGEKILRIVAPKTPNSYRKIPFTADVEKMFLSQREKQDRIRRELKNRWRTSEELGNLVFVTTMGSPVTRYIAEKETRKIVRDINMDESIKATKENRKPIIFGAVPPHSIRHSFCSRCFEAGMHPKVVQALMGHSDYSTTMNIYTHVSESMLKEESQKIVSLFEGEGITQVDCTLPNLNFLFAR